MDMSSQDTHLPKLEKIYKNFIEEYKWKKRHQNSQTEEE